MLQGLRDMSRIGVRSIGGDLGRCLVQGGKKREELSSTVRVSDGTPSCTKLFKHFNFSLAFCLGFLFFFKLLAQRKPLQ